MNPTVDIIIPCKNEEHYIQRCLDSILLQDFPSTKITVHIYDGKSTDNTQKIVHDYIREHTNFHYFVNEQEAAPFAFNRGINNSNGDVVIILGAHAELYPGYVHNCIKAFEIDTTIGCTGGIIENVYENKTSEIIGKAMTSSFGVGNAHFRTGNKDGFVDTVAFGAYKREVFGIIGLFDEELIRNQDDEFNYRLSKAGFKIYLSKNIRAKYYVRASFQKLYQQYFQYGYWKVYVNKKHKAITTGRQLVPLFFVCFLVIGLFVSILNSLFLKIYLLGILTYLTGSFYFANKQSSSPSQILELMKAFFILHFSYGSGYLSGIKDFFILNKQIKKSETLTR